MPPLIRTQRLESPNAVRLLRGDGVPEALWSRVRAEWRNAGGDAGRMVTVPVEEFLSNLAWFGPALRRYQVGVEWDEQTRTLLRTSRTEQEQLSQALRDGDGLSLDGVHERLSGGRFTRELLPFQLRDVGRLLALRHGANFSVPGAGKTVVGLATYEAERLAGRVERLLVVSPMSAFESWETEAHDWFSPRPHLVIFDEEVPYDAEIVVTNYQRLAARYEYLAGWVAADRTHVILDEAHRIKRGYRGQWGTACLSLAYLAARRDVLTGTPAPQSLDDLDALLNFLWPNQGSGILGLAGRSSPRDPAEAVGQVIGPLFVRTTKNELNLRPPDFAVVEVPLEGVHRDLYMALLDRYAGLARPRPHERVALAQMGRVVMYLLEAATNPALLVAGSSRYDPIVFRHPPLPIPDGSRISEILADYARYETPRKFAELAVLVEANMRAGRKTVIWSNFVRNLETLRHHLARYEPAVLHGGIPFWPEPGNPLSRGTEIRRFRGDPDCGVLLANPAAVGEGISLHHWCHDAVYLDRTFNAGQYLQSIDRIHRLGLDPHQATRVTIMVMEDTIDEVVDRRVRDKAARLGRILSDPDIEAMALPDEDDYGPPLETQEDLAELFAHLRGE
jgi:SNF2 family DNA or RNA helicase